MYSPLDPDKREIRLVTIKAGPKEDQIRCVLKHVSLDDSPGYAALSYVWGDPSIRVPILIDEHPFEVTENLALALRSLRQPENDWTFWIDAICVNQENLDERSAQVRLMKDIYQSAPTVVSWLGEKDEHAVRAAWFLAYAHENDFSSEWMKKALFEDTDNYMRASLLSLAICLTEHQRDYWSRLWITQEMAFAKGGHLQFGDFIIPYFLVQQFAKVFNGKLLMQLDVLGTSIEANGGMAVQSMSAVSQTIRQNEIATQVVQGTPLLELLELHRWKMASDPRDKVFGLLGLSDLSSSTHPGLRVDYSRTVQEVYVGVVQALVDTTSKLDVICDSHPEASTGKGQTNLPSWTPDWSIAVDKVSFRKGGASRASAAGDSPASVEFCLDEQLLRTVGFRIGTVKRCGDCMPERNVLAPDTKQELLEGVIQMRKNWRNIVHETLGDASTWDKNFERTMTCGSVDDHADYAVNLYNTANGAVASVDEHGVDPVHYRTALLEVALMKTQSTCENKAFFLIEPSISDPLVTDTTISHMGIGVRGVNEGDVICVFLGCSFPMVIRPEGHHFRVVGAAYVDQLMDGDAIVGLERGLYQVESFELR